MDFFELVKISTMGPLHLRLNQDVLRLIQKFMQKPKFILVCNKCNCTLLTERNEELFMKIEYFTDTNTDTHTCFDCYKFKGMKKYLSGIDLQVDRC